MPANRLTMFLLQGRRGDITNCGFNTVNNVSVLSQVSGAFWWKYHLKILLICDTA